MFRPTPVYLFRPVPALMKLKIHHPLPLNERESRALLNLLTSSFRKNLDAEHPTSRTEDSYRGRHVLVSAEEGNHADRHLHSVLSNPLFKSLRNKPIKSSQGIEKDPMETFDRATAMGMMNIRYATACLLATKRYIIASSVLHIQDGMKESGAGLKVLKWLVSSGISNDVSFLMDRQFTEVLMMFMVAEGLQEAIWKWIKMSFDSLPAASFLTGSELKLAQARIAWPLHCFVKAQVQKPQTLDAAYLSLSRAAGYLKGLPSQEMRPILGPAGAELVRRTLSSHNDRSSPSESHFESFLSLLPVFFKEYDLLFAHLHLVHPTKPDPQPALNYLRSMEFSDKKPSQPKRQIRLGLDTANFLVQQHSLSEVNWVLDLLQNKFPREMGVDEINKFDQAKAEATSLELLSQLGFT